MCDFWNGGLNVMSDHMIECMIDYYAAEFCVIYTGNVGVCLTNYDVTGIHSSLKIISTCFTSNAEVYTDVYGITWERVGGCGSTTSSSYHYVWKGYVAKKATGYTNAEYIPSSSDRQVISLVLSNYFAIYMNIFINKDKANNNMHRVVDNCLLICWGTAEIIPGLSTVRESKDINGPPSNAFDDVIDDLSVAYSYHINDASCSARPDGDTQDLIYETHGAHSCQHYPLIKWQGTSTQGTVAHTFLTASRAGSPAGTFGQLGFPNMRGWNGIVRTVNYEKVAPGYLAPRTGLMMSKSGTNLYLTYNSLDPSTNEIDITFRVANEFGSGFGPGEPEVVASSCANLVACYMYDGSATEIITYIAISGVTGTGTFLNITNPADSDCVNIGYGDEAIHINETTGYSYIVINSVCKADISRIKFEQLGCDKSIYTSDLSCIIDVPDNDFDADETGDGEKFSGSMTKTCFLLDVTCIFNDWLSGLYSVLAMVSIIIFVVIIGVLIAVCSNGCRCIQCGCPHIKDS